MNEWGIPDWRNATCYANAYGAPDEWGASRWRWEFYRRRDDLRRYFDKYADDTYKLLKEFHEIYPRFNKSGRLLRPDEPGFCAQVYLKEGGQFGYPGIPNPRISAQPPDVISPSLDGGVSLLKGQGERVFIGNDMNVSCAGDQAAVVFDLNKPISEQLEAVKRWLEFRQTDLHGKKLQVRKRETKYLDYLRVMDARESKARKANNAPRGWDEIAAIVYGDNAGGVERARKAYAAACSLCRNF